MLVDRRDATARPIVPTKRSLFALDSSDDDMVVDQADDEKSKRLMERWRFDMGDTGRGNKELEEYTKQPRQRVSGRRRPSS